MILQACLLFAVALIGGALNSVAGGGSFIVFPSLLATGISPIHANATTTVALWPGTVASVGAYRRELNTVPHARLLGAISLLGGWLGAVLLLRTPSATFSRLIPYLLLMATLVFAFGPGITAALRRRMAAGAGAGLAANESVRGEASSARSLLGLSLGQLVIATYGGYFGAGIGILMLAVFGLIGMENIHRMNALKTLLAGCINGVAVVTFAIAGAVEWPQAVVMLAGSVVGGYAGAAYARRLDPLLVRRFVLAVACVMTLYFFIRSGL